MGPTLWGFRVLERDIHHYLVSCVWFIGLGDNTIEENVTMSRSAPRNISKENNFSFMCNLEDG